MLKLRYEDLQYFCSKNEKVNVIYYACVLKAQVKNAL